MSKLKDAEGSAVVVEEELQSPTPDQKSIFLTHTPNDTIVPPNGGLKAWLQVVGGFCIFFNTWGILGSFGAYRTYYLKELLKGHTSSQLAWIGSTQAGLLFFVSFLTGPLYDLGCLRHLLIAGCLFTTTGLMLASIAKEYYQVLLTQGVIVGIGSGCLFVCCMTTIGQWFSTRRALAIGIESCGSAIGGIIYPLIVRQLMPRVGFGWTTRTVGFIALVVGLVPIALMRPLLPPAKAATLWKSGTRIDVSFACFNVGLLCSFATIYNVSFYVTQFAVQRAGADVTDGINLLIILNASSVVGKLGLVPLGDRYGPVSTMSVFALAAAIIFFCWPAIHSYGGLVALVVIYGIVGETLAALGGPGVVSLSDGIDGLGTRMAIALVSAGVGMLIGPPIAGAILGSSAGWLGLQCFCATLSAVAAICFVTARVIKSGRKLKSSV